MSTPAVPIQGTALETTGPERLDTTPARIVSGIPSLAEVLRSFGVYDRLAQERVRATAFLYRHGDSNPGFRRERAAS